MAAREGQEGFIGRRAMGEIGLQQPLDRLRRVLGLEVVIDLLPDIGVRAEAAAGEQMIALDRVVVLADRHLRRDQADIADVMLRAGMVAAGEMDVERRVDVDARLAPVADLGRMALGIRGRELAAGIAGAGDQPGADLRGLDREPDLLDRGNGELDILVAHARDQQVLPDRQADIAVAEILRNLGQPPHLLAGDLAERQRDADPVQALLLLLVHADMRHAVEGRPRRQRLRRHARKGVAELLLDEREELVDAHAVEHVFQPRLEPVGAVAGVDEDAHDGVGDFGRILRLDDDAGILGEILVAGDAAEAEAKPDAGLDAEAVLHLDRGKGDVVGVFQHRDLAGAVEGDVELARQAVSERSLRMW